ncbi:ATP-dependent Clp protease proteolytic subunit [Metapseudomonas otitidis]|uniref:ATP-dependent Clp protease proteolytic subunit n=1 Tax=Metapseudomonas otitidis TaxID=319939 RepID=UPI001AAE3F1D|nr:ATP-dependent Clp protease proteolytic subunit [Pseudomonas otitidis]MBO2929848.1 ATP-dependent Clp protease proteolytic subunit [Pseudomonas otitidis]
MRSHVVHFTAPINSHTCGQLIEKCSQAIQQGADELIIKIATMGGECSYGFSLYNFLVSLPVPVKTHNLGTVESMGNIIFLAGERRTACPYSKFLFHPFHWTLNGAVDHARMSEYAMSLDYDLHLYDAIVQARTDGARVPIDVLACLTAAPKIFNVDEALAAGLIHEVDCLGMPTEAVNWCVHS